MTQSVSTKETEELLNWEVLLKSDEAIYQALNVLNIHKDIFDFDKSFLESLIAWFTNPKYKKHFFTPKQSQIALGILCKRYLKKLQILAKTDTNFNTFLNSIEVKDEEFVEVVDEIKHPMDCPICIKTHKIAIDEIKDFVAVATGLATVKCDKCHTTITFLVEGV